MTTLDRPLRRELSIDRTAYVLTIEPDGFKLVLKGHRKGLEFKWRDLVSGEAALSVALNASLKHQKFVQPRPAPIGPARSGRQQRPVSQEPRAARKRNVRRGA